MRGASSLGNLLSLSGRNALVAGGSGGIGSAVGTLLASAGAHVFSADRAGLAAPEHTTALEGDLSRANGCEQLFEALQRHTAALDVLVHSVGITRDAVLWKLSDDDWSSVLATNLDSAFHLLKRATPMLRARGGGSVVLISSINGERGKFGQSNYAASKAGLIGFARSAARELGRFGIRVNVISPGMVRTAMTASLPEEHVRRAVDESALGRVAEPEDVARATLFLCSDMARHITGQVLRVDGGQLMA